MDHSTLFQTECVGQTLIVVLSERIDSLAGDSMTQSAFALLDEVDRRNIGAVVVDFGKVEYLGSFLLDTLCRVWKHVRQRSGSMALCNLSEVANDLLCVSRLNSLWPVYASRADAVAAVMAVRPQSSIDASTGSRISHPVSGAEPSRLRVVESGPCTVVGFTEGKVPTEDAVSRYVGEISRLIAQNNCREFVFDMTGVAIVPSGFLGLVATILKKGVRVSIRNASREVREILCIANFDRLLPINCVSRLNSLWPVHASRADAIAAVTRVRQQPFVDPSADSRLSLPVRDAEPSRLRVVECGPCTVVGFTEGNLPSDHVVSRYLDDIARLIAQNNCQELTFDMTGVSSVPSGFLGLLATILKKGARISIRNPSREVREVLCLANFDRLVHIATE